jgi:hypothetical protein
MSNAALESAIETAWEGRDSITPATKGEARDAIEATLMRWTAARCAWPNGRTMAIGM